MYFSDKFESIGCPDMQDVDAGGKVADIKFGGL